MSAVFPQRNKQILPPIPKGPQIPPSRAQQPYQWHLPIRLNTAPYLCISALVVDVQDEALRGEQERTQEAALPQRQQCSPRAGSSCTSGRQQHTWGHKHLRFLPTEGGEAALTVGTPLSPTEPGMQSEGTHLRQKSK